MRAVFELADKDGTGALNLQEFYAYVQDVRVQAYFRKIGLNVEKDNVVLGRCRRIASERLFCNLAGKTLGEGAGGDDLPKTRSIMTLGHIGFWATAHSQPHSPEQFRRIVQLSAGQL